MPVCFVVGVSANINADVVKGLFHNEDCTRIFQTEPFPPGKAGEAIDNYVDVMAGAGVKVFLCNTNSQRTNYPSRVWDSYWDGYDPAGADDQPFLKPVPRQNMRDFRNLVGNMLAVHQQGIDYPARVLQRCRHNGMSPWITLRMNDCHYNDIPTHPFHGRFWQKYPQFVRKNCPGYFAKCLDYAHPEVRDFYKSLIVETLDQYDIDGLELDFMREPYLFGAGKEAEGAPILTDWIRGIRKRVDAAATKRGHPIRLGVRVPSRPETALGLGLDAVAWAKEGLIDLLVVTPRWATIEFDMPIQQWRKSLEGSKATLAGGLEVLYQPYPGGPQCVNSPETATGAAVSVLSQGADAVYLFNYFQRGHPAWPLPTYQKTLKAMNSLDSLLEQPRSVGITYRDIIAPQEIYKAPLPATGKEIIFPLKIGPTPDHQWICELLLGFAARPTDSQSLPAVFVNTDFCRVHKDTVKNGIRLVSYHVPVSALKNTAFQEIRVINGNTQTASIQRAEMSFKKRDGT